MMKGNIYVKDITVYSQADITTSNDAIFSKMAEIFVEIEYLAKKNVDAKTEGGSFTGPELLALKEFEKLRLLLDYDLVTLLMKGDIINEIEKKNLHTVLPSGYDSAELAIEVEAGLSPSEQSNIKDLRNVVVPYILSREGSLAEFWQIKRSNIREIIPHLKVLINGKPSDTKSVNDTVERLKQDVKDVDPALGDGDITDVAISSLLEVAKNTKNRDLRDHLRPQDIPPMDAIVWDFENGMKFIFAKGDQDQLNKIIGTGDKYLRLIYMQIEDVKNARPVKEFRGKVYPTAEEKLNEYKELGTDNLGDGD